MAKSRRPSPACRDRCPSARPDRQGARRGWASAGRDVPEPSFHRSRAVNASRRPSRSVRTAMSVGVASRSRPYSTSTLFGRSGPSAAGEACRPYRRPRARHRAPPPSWCRARDSSTDRSDRSRPRGRPDPRQRIGGPHRLDGRDGLRLRRLRRRCRRCRAGLTCEEQHQDRARSDRHQNSSRIVEVVRRRRSRPTVAASTPLAVRQLSA